MTTLACVEEVENFIEQFDAVLEDISIDDKTMQLRLSHGYHYADLSKYLPVMVLHFINHNHPRPNINGWIGAYLSEIIVTGGPLYNVELFWNEMQSDVFSCERILVERAHYSAQDAQQKFERLSREYNERIESECAYAQKISTVLRFIDNEKKNLEEKMSFHGDDVPKADAELQKGQLLQKIKNFLSE